MLKENFESVSTGTQVLQHTFSIQHSSELQSPSHSFAGNPSLLSPCLGKAGLGPGSRSLASSLLSPDLRGAHRTGPSAMVPKVLCW